MQTVALLRAVHNPCQGREMAVSTNNGLVNGPVHNMLIFGSFFLHKLVDQYGALYLHYMLLLLPVGSFFLDDELVDHVSAWLVQEIVDHFARQWGGVIG